MNTPTTPQDITLAALGAVRAAFLEGRNSKHRFPQSTHDADLNAWLGSEAQSKLTDLSRSALLVFVEAEDLATEPMEITIVPHDE